MELNEIQAFIDKNSPIASGHNIAVEYSGFGTYFGFFDVFEDSLELRANNQWRFILNSNAIKYLNELEETRIANPIYSIIIDGSSVSELKLVRIF